MRHLVKFSVAAMAAAGLLTVSCDNQADPAAKAPTRAQLAVFQAEWGPELAPASAEMIAFGRDLYHEKLLSTQKNLSCASCHDLDKFGQDGEPTSPGSDGRRGDRNSPTSVNAFRQFRQFWDGRSPDVEDQAQGPVLNPIEHGFEKAEDFLAVLAGIDGMSERFAALFPGEDAPVTMANFGKAVGAFERTLVTKGRWDDYLAGDDAALTAEEKTGLAVFFEVGCITCHIGQTLGGGMFQKLGLLVPYETEDIGRAQVTGSDVDKFLFKVPILLNIAETAPYLHDGSVKTLEEAVTLMGKHQRNVELTDEQTSSIVTFLKALTGDPQWKS